jgi:DegV family protein with EDD domain
MSKVTVVTDSVANLPPELVERYSITVIPLLVAFGQEVFRDGVDMTSAQFYRRLREDKHLPTTSIPSMGDFLTLFHRLHSPGPRIQRHCGHRRGGRAEFQGGSCAHRGQPQRGYG